MTKKCYSLEHNFHATPIPSHPGQPLRVFKSVLSTYTLQILKEFVLLLHQFSEFLLQFFPQLFLLCKSFLQLLELINKKDKSKEITLLFYHNRALASVF